MIILINIQRRGNIFLQWEIGTMEMDANAIERSL